MAAQRSVAPCGQAVQVASAGQMRQGLSKGGFGIYIYAYIHSYIYVHIYIYIDVIFHIYNMFIISSTFGWCLMFWENGSPKRCKYYVFIPYDTTQTWGTQKKQKGQTQPLGIWSIVATIRWCPIFPKWDSYQPLVLYWAILFSRWISAKVQFAAA